MNKQIYILAILLLSINTQLFAGSITTYSIVEEVITDEVCFSVLEGDIKITMFRTNSDFQCIGIHYSDKNLNMVMGTCLELKREGKYYLVNIQYETQRFKKLDKAIEAYLKDLIIRNYKRQNRDDGEKVWKDFVKDGGSRKFIKIAKGWMDDEYLYSPWNTIYG